MQLLHLRLGLSSYEFTVAPSHQNVSVTLLLLMFVVFIHTFTGSSFQLQQRKSFLMDFHVPKTFWTSIFWHSGLFSHGISDRRNLDSLMSVSFNDFGQPPDEFPIPITQVIWHRWVSFSLGEQYNCFKLM